MREAAVKRRTSLRRALLVGAHVYAALILLLFALSKAEAYRAGIGAALEALLVIGLLTGYGRGGWREIVRKKNLLPACVPALGLFYPLSLYLGERLLVPTLMLLSLPVFSLLVYAVRRFIRALAEEDSPLFAHAGETALSPRRTALLCGCFALTLLLVFHRTEFFPYGMTADSYNQWMQIHGQIPYSDIHSIGHTLLLALLLRVRDSFTFVVVLQLVLTALVFTLFFRAAAKRGAHACFLMLLAAVFLTPVAPIDVLCYPLKDVPYTLCVILLTGLLMRYVQQQRFPVWEALLFGALLALVYEFRKNGVVLLLVLSLSYTVSSLRKRAWKQLAAFGLSVAVVLGGIHWVAYDVLKTESPENGWGVQVFATGLVAAAKDGKATPEEREAIAALLPLDWAESAYKPWYLNDMLWWGDGDTRIEQDPSLAVFNNGLVLAMCEHRAEIVKLYVRLLPRHALAYIKNILYSTHMIWGIQPTQCLPMSNVFLLLWLYLLVDERWSAERKKRGWPVFLPMLLNLVSIAISTVTNELRYLLPTTLLCPLLTLYIILNGRRESLS